MRLYRSIERFRVALLLLLLLMLMLLFSTIHNYPTSVQYFVQNIEDYGVRMRSVCVMYKLSSTRTASDTHM
jgi:hypothetical protein